MPVAFPIALSGGATVTVSEWRANPQHGAALCLPALGVPASYYTSLAEALAMRGVSAVTSDLRGLGASSVRPRRGVDWGYAQLVDDAAMMAAAVRARGPGPLVLVGHSIGGHVGAILAGACPGAIDGLALVACGTPYWRRFGGGMGLQVLALAWIARASSAALGYYPGERIGFAGREAAQLMGEWSRLARYGRFEVAGLDAERAIAEARLPVLALPVPGDDKAPGTAVQHLVAKFAATAVTMRGLDPARFDPRGRDHIRWVRYPDPVAKAVADWMQTI